MLFDENHPRGFKNKQIDHTTNNKNKNTISLPSSTPSLSPHKTAKAKNVPHLNVKPSYISTRTKNIISNLLRNVFNTSYELHKWNCFTLIIDITIPTDVKMLTNKRTKQQLQNINYKQLLNHHIERREKHLNENIKQLQQIVNQQKLIFDEQTVHLTFDKLLHSAINSSKGIRNRIWTKTYKFVVNLAIKVAYVQLSKLNYAVGHDKFIKFTSEANTIYTNDLYEHQNKHTIPKFIQNYKFYNYFTNFLQI